MRGVTARGFRFLLRLLPRDLREAFGNDMTQDLLARLKNARGPWRKGVTWLGAVVDVLVQSVELRFEAREGRAEKPGRSGLLASFGRDLRHGGRKLLRSPSFTLIAVLTLALGIGSTTVSFSLVKGVLLKPLPFPAGQDLVVVRQISPERKTETLSFPNFDDLRSQTRSLSGLAALRFPASTSILGGEEPCRGVVVQVSREFFSVMGVAPFLGRPILPEENQPDGVAVAVVSYEFWTRALGRNEDLSDVYLTVDRKAFQVVGVMPPGFKVLEEADVYLPLERDAMRVRSSSNYRGVGRLAPGATLEGARAELNGLAHRIQEAYPREARLAGLSVENLRKELLGEFSRPLFLLLGASALLLLLACSNVATTLMARRVRREREMAIRTALGGGKRRLVQLVFGESLILSVLSGVSGLALTFLALKALALGGDAWIPGLPAVGVDGTVLVFSFLVTLLTAFLFGLIPALRLPEPSAGLRGGSSTRAPGRKGRGWNVMVGGQVALAVSLVVASGLLLRSMGAILSADTNIHPEGVLTVGLDLSTDPSRSYVERWGKLIALEEDLGSLPGVGQVGFVSYLPDRRSMMTGTVFRPPLPADGLPEHYVGDVGWRVVDEGYFEAMGIPLLQGRYFTREDLPTSRPVIILNESLAATLFPGEDAVGSMVGFAPFWDEEIEVVGVVAEARDWRVPKGEQPEGYVFVGQKANYATVLTMLVRTGGAPADLIPAARDRLRGLFPAVPGNFRTMESLLADSYRDRTFVLGVLGIFALLSLVLASVGISGVVSYTVSSRAREIGIMLALGAERWEVRRRMFIRSLYGVLAGIAVGMLLAVVAGRVMESLLFQVEPTDAFTLTLAPLVLLVSGGVAILLPVVRYTRIDPAQAMRVE